MDLDVHGGRTKAGNQLSGPSPPKMQLRNKAVRSVQWASLSQAVKQLVQFGTITLLAVILAPGDFGILQMALVVTGMVDLFKDLGTRVAIIQKKDATDRFLSSIFWVNAGIGLIAALVLIGLAPWVATIYNEPQLTLILQVLALNFPISGLGVSLKTYLEKSIAFDTIGIIEAGSTILGAIAAIVLAFMGFGVWSLVVQSLVATAGVSILSWIFSSWRPTFTFHWPEIRGVLGYSLNYTGYTFLNYIARNADYFLIGRYLGGDALGYYTLAYRIMVYPIQNISGIINKVMFPVLSKVQDNNELIGKAYLQIAKTVSLVAFPLMLGVMALASPFVLVVLREKWQPIITLLLILAPVGLLQSINSTVGAIFLIKDRTASLLKWGLFSASVIIGTFVFGLQYGIEGMAWAYLATSIFLFIPSLQIPMRFIELPVRKVLIAITRPLLGGLLMLGILVAVQWFLPDALQANPYVFASLVVLGILIYAGYTWTFNRASVLQIRELISASHRKNADPSHS